MNYYFAYKVNPIDAIQCNFPRPDNQAYGALCDSFETARTWLQQADVPEHAQDWLYSHYKLPALDLIITAAPFDARTTLPRLTEGSAVPIFAHHMREVDIVQTYAQIGADEVHDIHMLGSAQGRSMSSDNMLLRAASVEMLTRMSQLEDYHQAMKRHPDIPESAMRQWASTMYAQGVSHHGAVPGYFDEFVQQYLQHVAQGEKTGPQYGASVTTTLAIESTARYLYEERGSKDDDAFEKILEGYAEEAFPYKRERFMNTLEPNNYKAALLDKLPEWLHEDFSKQWDARMMDLRISNQVELRQGTVRVQDLALQATIDVCTEMEYDAFRAQNSGHQYAALRSAAMHDQITLEAFDQSEMDGHEEEID